LLSWATPCFSATAGTVDAEVYDGLHSVLGRRRISRFLNDLARPHVVGPDLFRRLRRCRLAFWRVFLTLCEPDLA
jgi:hypothetical protein